MRVRPLRPVLAVVAAASMAGGCGGGGGEERAQPLAPLSKSAVPSASASITPASSPRPTPKATPSGPTPASAAAFVRAYYAAVNSAALSGRSKGLSGFASKGCTICDNHLRSSKYLEARDQHLDDRPIRVLSVRGDPVEGTLTTVTVKLQSTDANIVDASGRKVRQLRFRPPFSAGVALAWNGDRWRLVDIVEFS